MSDTNPTTPEAVSIEAKPLTVNYGGQAVIEGVMMRGSRALSVAVRNPQGDIVVHTEGLDQRIYGSGMAKVPFLRGLTLLWDALGLGIKALMFSADVAIQEDEPAEGEEPQRVFEGPVQWTMVAFSLTMMVLIFFVLPTFVASLIETWLNLPYLFLVHLTEGIIRLLLLVGYIWIIGFMSDVKRLYGYHGAEHKTINAYEADADLTPDEVATYPIEHPRCGTAFLLTVVVISIILYSFLPDMTLPVRILSRLLLLHQANAFIRLITKPNLALQGLTTREPDTGMLQVAIVAFESVLAYEKGAELVEGTRTIPGSAEYAYSVD